MEYKKKIPADVLIARFRRMHEERWAYAWGSAREGCVDCSGAFVWALNRSGIRVPHGSNSLYRTCAGAPVNTPSPGYAAFRIRRDGREPERFRGDGIGNVFHIGLVDADGEHVLNAKGSRAGFCRDGVSGWSCFAPMSFVSYEKEEKMEEIDKERTARVRTKGGRLNLRRGRGLRYAPVALIPNGETVAVTEADDGSGWAGVRFGALTGYVKAQYLEYEEAEA